MPMVLKYYVEFNVTPGADGWIGGPPGPFRKPHGLDRFVWPKLWDSRDEADAFLAALDAGNSDRSRARFRGLFANKDTAIPGRRIKSAAVQSVRVS